MITADKVRSTLKYIPETGEFVRLVGSGKGAKRGQVTLGSIDASNGYRRLCVGGKQYYAHRLAWLWVFGEWPEDQIDHINQIRSDNRWANLRAATNKQNNERSLARANSKTGVLGVSWHKRASKYVAQIRHHGETIYLGLYTSIDDAKTVRDAAASVLFTHGNREAIS